jgi:hypothetical protein
MIPVTRAAVCLLRATFRLLHQNTKGTTTFEEESEGKLGHENAYHPNKTCPTNVPTRATAVTAELGPIGILDE